MEVEQLFAMVFVLGMFAGVLVIFLAMRQRSQYLEMQHRERMAMIERGLTPGPSPIHRVIQARASSGGGSTRSMTLGIVVIAIGLALMSIISIAAATPDVGVGIGGAIMIVGIAFVVNSLVTRNMASVLADRPEPPAPPLPPV